MVIRFILVLLIKPPVPFPSNYCFEITKTTTKLSPSEFRRIIAETYDAQAPIYEVGLERAFFGMGWGWEREVTSFLEFLEGSLVLDVGCGSGRLSKAFSRRDKEVVGVDISANMLKIARMKAPDAHVILADAENLPFRDGIFDSVVSSRAVKMFPHPLKFFKDCNEVLKASGRLIISSETYDLLWLRLAIRLQLGIRLGLASHTGFPEFYRTTGFYKDNMRKAGFKVCDSKCIIYFPVILYIAVLKLSERLLGLINIIDERRKVGRNTLIVGIKPSYGA